MESLIYYFFIEYFLSFFKPVSFLFVTAIFGDSSNLKQSYINFEQA